MLFDIIIYKKIFLPGSKVRKYGCAFYTTALNTRVNTVYTLITIHHHSYSIRCMSDSNIPLGLCLS